MTNSNARAELEQQSGDPPGGSHKNHGAPAAPRHHTARQLARASRLTVAPWGTYRR